MEDEQMSELIERETQRLRLIHNYKNERAKEKSSKEPFRGVVAVRWPTGYAIIDANAFIKMPQTKLKKLTGGSYEKRKINRHKR